MNDELPRGWESIELQNIASWGSGGTPPRKNPKFYGGDIPWIKTGELGDGLILDTKEKITAEGLKKSSAKLFPKGSVAIAMYGATIGKVSILGIDAATNQACAVGIPDLRATSAQYIFQYLRSQRDAFIGAGKGGAQPNLSQGVIKEWPFPLAPLAEQKRIADKLELLLGRVDACRARLDRVPGLLKRFRQSVLAAATSGKLTKEWRNQNSGIADAATVLAEIESTKEGKLRVRKSNANLDALSLFDVPPKWSWVKNHRLAADANTAICAGPFGTIFKAKDFRDSGVPIIFLRHVAEGQYLTRKPGFMDRTVWKAQHQEYSIHGGELLVTKLGDPPGTACIYPEGIGTAMVTPDVMKMDVDQRVVDPLFLMYFFNSPLCKDLVGQMAFGATRLRIDLTMFKNFPIPLPPRAEQQEIVRRVETLFAFADRIEARLATAQKTVERLTPATLAKAFRGELVPQDPNDEPASALLERLSALKAATPTKAKKRKPRVTNKPK